jgi:hypothetical protein
VGFLGRSGHAREGLDVAGEHRIDAVVALHHPVDDQDGLAVGDLPVALVNVGFDGDVDLAELVLQGEESDLLGGRGGLARDDQTGDSHVAVVADGRELVALQRSQLPQAFAAEVDEVVAGGQI